MLLPNKTHRLVMAGILTAVGLLLPFVTAHAYGIPGTVLLPMHIPVFLMGFLCGPMFGALGGLTVPLLSSLLTGMPAAFPMLPIMMAELFTYGLLSGLFYSRAKLPVYPALLLSMVCGRAAYGVMFAVLTGLTGTVPKAAAVPAALITGLPGVIAQLILVPAAVMAVKRAEKYGKQPNVTKTEEYLIEKALADIQAGTAGCVVIQDNRIVYSSNARGIAPLLSVLDEQPQLLNGAVVVDRIIGKAAAMLVTLGGVRRVFGDTMSAAARDYLSAHGIRFGYVRCIEMIQNRENTGICPMEAAVWDLDDPAEAKDVLARTQAKLRSAV